MMRSLLVLLIFCSYVSALYREECHATVRNMLLNGTLSAADNQTFSINKAGIIMSNLDRPVLTRVGCERICGAPHKWYKDWGSRLNMWLMPVLLLIVNMEVPSLDKRRYFTIIHLLGDPIDTLWSLISKLEIWSWCYTLARNECGLKSESKTYWIDVQTIATVLGGIEDVVGPGTDPLPIFNNLIPEEPRGRFSSTIRIAALKLADGRTDDLFRTALAIILYLYQMLAAFISVIGGGNSSHPGGRIGTSMFLTWLLPIVLLSNAMGSFNSGRTSFESMRELCESVRGMSEPTSESAQSGHTISIQSELTDRIRDGRTYLEAQSWSGLTYSCLYRKSPAFRAKSSNRSQAHLFCLAILPVLTASGFGSAILWKTPPGGLNCRNIMIIVITLLWLLSVGTTWFFGKPARWKLILAKDALIAFASISSVVLSSVGVFNSCGCWSGFYFFGRGRTQVPLNPSAEFEYNYQHLYPFLVGACLITQLGFFAYIARTQRKGLRVLRWRTKDKTVVHNRYLNGQEMH